MGEVHTLDMLTRLDIPVKRVKAGAKKNCEKCVVIGIDKKGEPYYASSFSGDQETLWMIEQFKQKLLNGDFR